ncbi:class I SAM-dependent methyltransferase [Polaromonas sp. A23]|uniref:class I SAM-dependent methyltransferase n=1 Tax=Polaromonas sp. A23 TaxID=1944133 RepID=UPI000986A6D2|nr:class I SAM-dependent methyltransferase [Polaromonas sp. A23]OOG43871.1 hypothetical protein B0B52_08105 [Polaromonas sp. A23]
MDVLLAEVEQYYTRKIDTYGATPLGVDWACVPTQQMRFVQLLKFCNFDSPVTLNDLGCGYGALLAFLSKRFRGKAINYLGIDLSPAMIAQAQKLWGKRRETKFVVASNSPRIADYSIASGIFNVKLTQTDDLWTQFVATTLANMHATSRRGFAVNFLTPLPEGVIGITELYRPPSELWSNYCQKRFGATVEILNSYGMREYTLLIRKTT